MTDGVINVYKQKGMTSFGVVARLRRIFGQKKIGHAGTLDPDAEGVLPVCLGRGTKLVEKLMKTGTKTYVAVLLMGRITDTQDISGHILEERPVEVTEEGFRKAFLSFSGEQMQLPPMYSALKVNGKKLVDLARKGIEVERTPRKVEFTELEILSFRPPLAKIEVTSSHGGYIRTLCHDLGEKLGCGACMESLVRTRVGDFLLEDALTLDEIEERKAKEESTGSASFSFVRPPDDFYRELPAVRIKPEGLPAVLNGASFPLSGCVRDPSAGENVFYPEGSCVRAYDTEEHFIGIYRIRDGRCCLEQYFAASESSG